MDIDNARLVEKELIKELRYFGESSKVRVLWVVILVFGLLALAKVIEGLILIGKIKYGY